MQNARLGLDPYAEFLSREGLVPYEGIACDLIALETKPWARAGINAAVVHLTGRGNFANLFLFEIPGGGSSHPQRHLYEEIMFVIEGRGSTMIEHADGTSHSFEWQRNSMFAIPLNATYRMFNADGHKRALVASTTSLPMMLRVFHSEEFVFNNTHFFKERIGKDAHYDGGGDLTLVRPGSNIWETNFVPDLGDIGLTEWSDRGAGSLYLKFFLADSNMHTHVSEIQTGTYKKAHRHGGGRHVFTITGTGYSLLWYEGDKDFTRVDWRHGVVFPPVDQQIHQHFVTSREPSRYLATGVSNARYPLTEADRLVSVGADGGKGSVSRSMKDGGGQIEYEDQDPRIHTLWLEEMRTHGITPQFEKYGIPLPPVLA